MGKRKWITANRVTNILYWYCPCKGCDAYESHSRGSALPHTIHCKCGGAYIVHQIGRETSSTARLLIEVRK